MPEQRGVPQLGPLGRVQPRQHQLQGGFGAAVVCTNGLDFVGQIQLAEEAAVALSQRGADGEFPDFPRLKAWKTFANCRLLIVLLYIGELPQANGMVGLVEVGVVGVQFLDPFGGAVSMPEELQSRGLKLRMGEVGKNDLPRGSGLKYWKRPHDGSVRGANQVPQTRRG